MKTPMENNTHSVIQSSCRLCGAPVAVEMFRDKVRPYLKCGACGLVFVPERFHVTPREEKTRYAKHTNSPDDEKYVSYLSKIAVDVLSLPVPSPRIVDFGSGPAHVLSDILSKGGATCVPHDPLYGLDASMSPGTFDIAVLCESIEHLRNLPKEIALISNLVKPEGFVYVHTQLYDGVVDIRSWWYLLDVTHVNFFCVRTMEKAGEMMGKRIISTNRMNMVIFGGTRGLACGGCGYVLRKTRYRFG
jgi:hypothetical protein